MPSLKPVCPIVSDELKQSEKNIDREAKWRFTVQITCETDFVINYTQFKNYAIMKILVGIVKLYFTGSFMHIYIN